MNPKLKKALIAVSLVLVGVIFGGLIRSKVPGADKLPAING